MISSYLVMDSPVVQVLIISGFENYYRYTYVQALRNGLKKKKAALGDLSHEWRPVQSAQRYVNPFSRIRDLAMKDQTVERLIFQNWDAENMRFSPRSHFGVIDIGERDCNGKTVYHITDQLNRLTNA